MNVLRSQGAKFRSSKELDLAALLLPSTSSVAASSSPGLQSSSLESPLASLPVSDPLITALVVFLSSIRGGAVHGGGIS